MKARTSVSLATIVLFFAVLSLTTSVYAQPTSSYISSVHYHHQVKSYYCGPAALEMLFDFYGQDVLQREIADVARTSSEGTYTDDIVRAAHFSNLSISEGKEMQGNITGYSDRKIGYAAFEYWSMTLDQLKNLIAQGYPIIVLTTWHFRVAMGYNSTHITFQDSYYGSMFNMTWQDFDMDWDYSNHWGIFVSPWLVQLTAPRNVQPGQTFDVWANITYPLPLQFPANNYPASMPNATITLPDGLSLVSGETAKKTLGSGDFLAGQSQVVKWTVKADTVGNYMIPVEADGNITGTVWPIPPTYPEFSDYEDRIGGTGQGIIAVTSGPDVTPPNTLGYYDGVWHGQDFKINLTATDEIDGSGVMETYYRINNGSIRTLSSDGQPLINSEGDNGKLEYWSEDWAGNEEAHHTITGIKLDKMPPRANAGLDQTVAEDTIMSFNGTASLDNMEIISYTWSFTDGEPKTLTGIQPIYTFADPGIYIVELNVSDVVGHYAVDKVTISVFDVTPPAANPGDNKIVDEDALVTLDGSQSHDNVGIVSYVWTFMEQFVPHMLTGSKVNTTFTQPGTYSITLRVTDSVGKWDNETVTIQVLDVTCPVVMQTRGNRTVSMGDSVIFDAGFCYDNVGVSSYKWDFGDGTESTEMKTAHSYTFPGTYSVMLEVTDAAGNTAVDTATVTVVFSQTFILIVGGIIASVATAVAAWILWKKKK